MAEVIITIKVMPENSDTDLKKVEEQVKEKISDYGGEVGKVEIEPIAFGLSAVKIIFVVDEDKGSTDELEEAVNKLEGVMNVEVIDVRRAIG